MRNDWLQLSMFSMDLPAIDRVAVRIVELTVTYVAHSTLFLLSAWILLACLQRMRRSTPHPAITEITWKLAAVLPLVTALLGTMMDGSFTRVNLSIPSLISMSGRANRESSVQSDVVPSRDDFVRFNEEQIKLFARNSDLTTTQADDSLDVETPVVPNQQSDVVEVESRDSRLPAEADRQDLESLNAGSSPTNTDVTADLGLFNSRSRNTSRGDISDRPEAVSIEKQTTIPSCLTALAGAIVVWLILSTLRLARKSISLSRWLRSCTPIKGGMRNQLDSLVLQGRRIRLVWADYEVASRRVKTSIPDVRPFACGVWQWTIVMPIGIDDRLSKSESRALLAHEVAHLIRRDTVWQWFGQFLCSCLAFQPLNFVARQKWQQAGELLCDDWAIEHKVIPTLLASCLTRIAEWQLEQTATRRRASHLGLPAIGQSGTLTHRIHWLLRADRANQSQRSIAKAVTTFAIFAAGIVVGITGPRLVVVPIAQAQSMTDEVNNGDSLRTQITHELAETETELIELQSRLRAYHASELFKSVESFRKRLTAVKEEIQE